jgi:hypothetical protein
MQNDTGDELEVRGYIGFSLLGCSKIWKRIELFCPRMQQITFNGDLILGIFLK